MKRPAGNYYPIIRRGVFRAKNGSTKYNWRNKQNSAPNGIEKIYPPIPILVGKWKSLKNKTKNTLRSRNVTNKYNKNLTY